MDRLMTAGELAAHLNLKRKTVYDLILKGEAPPVIRIGAGPRPRVRFRRADVDAWLARLSAKLAD